MKLFNVLPNLKRQNSGATAVEFALIVPVFFVILFGVIFYGLIIGIGSSLQHTAQEAARASIAGMTDTERDSLARSRIQSLLSGSQLIRIDALTIATGSSSTDSSLWTVSLTYNIQASGLANLARAFVVTPDMLKRSASYRNGGY
ncbi:TadE/TadG family type IV pilus assembly protein [Methylobacterium thuringiense]|uniref:TadE/TadG family type IV pilus assembly protein n=1 Tax=Methylobacterium thuringiense TaxID=1003091 RepID=UPI001EE0F003|nr:TadE/TadG family type IV pilus assembly protein [Methylobacterium thuringiense]